MNVKAFLAMTYAAWGSGLVLAGEEVKDRFTLFNPTPRHVMREMSTDRPDTTESPYTVDAGHVQLEISLVDYGYDKEAGVRTRSLGVLPTNVKLGLLNNVDVQFVFTPYQRVETKAADTGNSIADGFGGDAQIRLKINLWGNDGPEQGFGETALAIMPFVKFPTGSGDLSNDHVEGGLIVPLAISLPHEFSLGLMAEIDLVYDEGRDGYGVDLVHTATLSRPIVGELAGYVEYIGIAPRNAGHTYQAIASGGFTYAITEDWALDCGVTFGISDSADDFTAFVGTSFRF